MWPGEHPQRLASDATENAGGVGGVVMSSDDCRTLERRHQRPRAQGSDRGLALVELSTDCCAVPTQQVFRCVGQ